MAGKWTRNRGGFGGGQECGFLISSHNDQNLILVHRNRFLVLRITLFLTAAILHVPFTVFFVLQSTRNFPVGASQDQESKGYETKHGGESSEQVRNGRVPRGVRRGSG
ncbi:hypothetical protein V8G54_007768 [Vigna mungo]|uniref:Transmembrane protein n=1 Tax=Vigna mungo TaxID=3915 RepID=A0AAQ3S991_VIGMU